MHDLGRWVQFRSPIIYIDVDNNVGLHEIKSSPGTIPQKV